jgi:hypothetical protein
MPELEPKQDVFHKKTNAAERLAAEARDADPRDAAELQKAAMAERVDLLKAQTQTKQKSMQAAAVQIKTVQAKLFRLREEMQLPPPQGDDPSVAAYKEHIAQLQVDINKAEKELADLMIEEQNM